MDRCEVHVVPTQSIPVFPASMTRGRRGTSTTCKDGTTRSQSQQLTIYVRDLSPKVDSSRLRDMFSKHGKVTHAKVVYDKCGRLRGFGFVTMATQKGFNKAMAARNAVEWPHRNSGIKMFFSLHYFIASSLANANRSGRVSE
uniref:RRM domain-containing protein n=1 Tax=Aegilops tauschii subsp. strangulata TaxID=200361 RepID=A0A453SY62_AEGTS